MNKSNKKSQAFKIFKLSNLSKKLFALLTISVLSITTGACVDKKADNQDPAPTPAPTPVPTNQLDVLAIDKEKAFFVTPTGTKDKDCTTWKNACDLQTAIDKANKDATKKFVLVAKGTYFADPAKTDIEVSFNLKNGVKIYGGFDATDINKPRNFEASILEGKLSDTLNTKLILKGEILSAETILDGFVIQNALNKDDYAKGAGLYLKDSNPKLTNLVFKNNNSSDRGGAIFNNNSSPSISNSTFIGNSTAYGGGAIYNTSSSPSISNSTFIGNSTKNYGGAIENNNNSSPNISNSAFSGNFVNNEGGAIFNYNSSPSISNSTFSGNSTKYNGGAIFNNNSSPSISNSKFSGNSAYNDGGAIFNYNSSPSISNSILWNNKDKHTGGESINNIYNYDTVSKPTIKNSILNAGSAVTMQSGQSDYSKTNPYNFMDFSKAEFKDNQTPANFVIESDGKVIDADSKKLIKDKGDNALYKTTTGKDVINDKDLAGKPRLNGTSIDIGAYELQD